MEPLHIMPRETDEGRDAFGELGRAAKQAGRTILNTLESGIRSGEKFSDTLKRILFLLAEIALNKLGDLLTKEDDTGKGIFETVAGAIAGAFTGNLFSSTAPSASSGTVPASPFTFAGPAAAGGRIPAGSFGLVGEAGPELAFAGPTGVDIAPIAAAASNLRTSFPSADRLGGGNGSSSALVN